MSDPLRGRFLRVRPHGNAVRNWRRSARTDESNAMARNSNDRWTPEEDKRLLQLRADGKSYVFIAATLHRTLSSVEARIFVVRRRAAGGAKVTPTEEKRTMWSHADEQRLIDLKGTGASVSEIAIAMKRSEAAIENRLHVLKHRARPVGTASD
jgi:hypothetical protein